MPGGGLGGARGFDDDVIAHHQLLLGVGADIEQLHSNVDCVIPDARGLQLRRVAGRVEQLRHGFLGGIGLFFRSGEIVLVSVFSTRAAGNEMVASLAQRDQFSGVGQRWKNEVTLFKVERLLGG